MSLVLTWSLYTGVSGLHGINSGPRAHLGGGCEPTGGANFLVHCSVKLKFSLSS
jgi:hypothetical protein